MNQLQIQTEQKEQRMLDKANFLVANKRIRRSLCKESKNIWIVSQIDSQEMDVVRWNEELAAFMCDCKAFFAVDAYIFAGEKFESE